MAELKAEISIRDIPLVVAELERLRALIKTAEYANESHGEATCPWCGEVARGHRWTKLDDPAHRDQCEAFTPAGEVK